MKMLRTALVLSSTLLLAALTPSATASGVADEHSPDPSPGATLLVGGLGSGSGSTIGPDGALYVAEPLAGSVVRVDPRTGGTSTFATGLPTQLPGVGVGGVMDVAFLRHRAYALVTLVGSDVGGTATVGLYRIDGPDSSTVVADIGTWSIDHPPATSFFIPSGVQYALQRWHHGFLVTDGHHNRVLRVTTTGAIREVIAFDDIVPTGLDVRHRRVYLAEAGPVPHDPATGKVVTFVPGDTTAATVASGASILTDVELATHGSRMGHRHHRHHGADRVYAISNGAYSGAPEGSPGLPDTGSLVVAGADGQLHPVVDHLDRPTSLEIRRETAYIVTLDGEVWTVPLGH